MLETSAESPAPVRVVSEALKGYVERLGPIWIEGEISEINERAGMAFMRLRDTSVDMSLSVMCHRTVLAPVSPLPPNARVVMLAKVSFYTKNGSLGLSVKEIRQVGIGELLARLEHLKQLLASEGLFALDLKRELPLLPKRVGLICGRNSAAEKDVVENAKRRWPAVQFEIREVAVQGSAAVIEVSAALRELEANPEVDVIIITRGGGSFEDLLPFSDEGLVRLAASCKTPIVSAIGHEQDAPLLDLVADVRASTPTDAAKRVVPDIEEEFAMINQLRARAYRRLSSFIELESGRIISLKERPVLKEPMVLITSRVEVVQGLRDRSHRSTTHALNLAREELLHIYARVRSLSPQSTLDRGYAVVQLLDGRIARDPKDLAVGEKLRLRLALGEIGAVVTQS
ncbi:MAG: exodeoxyribonuclease VII large subunit [Candidatus Nanopelagicaceae bacterium]|nr:exodeoxyribonuclease VII large subunit [Candidatus Nanopelagicaceae bacterium]